MRTLARLLSVLLFVVSAASLSVPCSAQATSGSVSGVISDSTGAVVPKADVTAHAVATGVDRHVAAGDAGEYTISALPPGVYTLSAQGPGFRPASAKAFQLNIDQKARIDLTLQVGASSDTVTVTDAAPVLQTQGAETGGVIGSRELQDLPLINRDFTDLMLLIPGVVRAGGGNQLNLSVNGQREFTNSVQVNGNEVTSNRNNDLTLRPSVDATQEFKVVTSDYAPEFGRAAGGAIIIQTKSGTNSLHGGAYEFFRPNNTAANGRFATPGSEPILKQHTFGATLGGPVRKDRTFVFGAYEGFRLIDAFYYALPVPTTNQVVFRANGDADLSGLKDPYTNNTIPIFDPAVLANSYYVQQFPGNVIPAARVSPAGRKILQQLFPAPQNGNYFANFNVNQRYEQVQNTGNFRLDHVLSSRDRIYLTYDMTQGTNYQADPYGAAIPIQGGGGADNGNRTSSENQSITATYDRTISSNLLNEFRAGYLISAVAQKSLLDGTNLASQFGIANANVAGFPSTSGFPQIQFASGAVTGGSTYKPLTFRDQNLTLGDALTYTRGHHNFKVGYEFRSLRSAPNYSLFPAPYEYFGGAYSALTSDANYCNYSYDPTCGSSQLPYGFYDGNAYYGTGGSEIADLLLGLPTAVFQGLQTSVPKTRTTEHSAYLQDYWQVTPSLNLTFGARYEFQAPYSEATDAESNFDPATLTLQLAARGTNSRSLINSDKNNLMPRVGLSYQITPKLVVRSGYGIFYSPENDAKNELLTQNYPFYTQQQFSNSAYSLTYSLDAGAPRITAAPIPAGASSIALTKVPNATSYTVNYIQPNSPTAYSQSFNLTVQRQLPFGISAEVGYVGAVARKLSYEVGDINRASRLSKQVGKVNALFPVGQNSYNSLQAKINKSFANGYGLLASYTYSKNLDNGPAPFNLGRGNQQPQDPFNLRAEYAPASTDVRHNLVVSQVIELPVGKGKLLLRNANAVEQAILGGWQLNSITTLHTGLPFNIVSNANNVNYPGLRPNVIKNPKIDRGSRTLSKYFDTTAFVLPAKQATTFAVGNAPRDFLFGPGYTNEDFSLFKVFTVRERYSLQLRAEAFNALNTPHYGQPNGNLAAGVPMNGQLGGFGSIDTQVGNSRVMQFAAKLNF